MKTVYGIIFGVLLILLVAFVYSTPEDDKVTLSKIEPDSTTLASNPPSNPAQERILAAFPDPNPYMQEVASEYGAFIENAIKRGMAPGAAVAIIRDTSVIFLKGFGLKQTGTTDSIDVNTVFRLGSVSKCMASVLAGALVSNNLINWDDPVVKYFPEFELKSKEYTQQLTIRHVLSHTTGLPYHAYTNMIEEHLPLDTLMKYLKLVASTEPGKIYSYQNVGYSLIQKVVENASHESFEEALSHYVFKPLDMRSGSASYEAIMQHNNVARPHYFSRKRWVTVPISDTYYNSAPAGGINASISDMALWLRALLNGSEALMSDSTLNEIFEPQVKAISKNRNFWRWKRPRASYYALGWRVINFKDDTLEYHGGYVNGYRSEVAIDRKNRLAICVLTNSPGSLSDLSIPEFFKRYTQKADFIQDWDNRSKLILVNNTNFFTPVSNN
jgi:beta-lactamase class C